MEYKSPYDFQKRTMEPIQITNIEATRIHGQRQCINVRHNDQGVQYVHCMKFSTNPKSRYKNTIGDGKAKISMNLRTPKENKLVLKGTPVHIITYGGGTATLYHGRYKCCDPHNSSHFIMEYYDEGMSGELEKETEKTRKSKLEQDAETFFISRGWISEYEPIIVPYGNNKHYTPDFYLPEFHCLVEIKGFWSPQKEQEPTQLTYQKCKAVKDKGFSMLLLQGSALDDPVFTYWQPYSEPEAKSPWWWNKRKRL